MKIEQYFKLKQDKYEQNWEPYPMLFYFYIDQTTEILFYCAFTESVLSFLLVSCAKSLSLHEIVKWKNYTRVSVPVHQTVTAGSVFLQYLVTFSFFLDVSDSYSEEGLCVISAV